MTLSQQIHRQKTAIAEFEQAIAALESPQGYAPAPSEPLDFLKRQQADAANEQERKARLKQAEQALAHSRDVLAELEQRWGEIERLAAEGRDKLHATAQKVNELVAELAAAIALLQQIDSEHGGTFEAVFGRTLLSNMYGDRLPLATIDGQFVSLAKRS